MFNHIVLDIAIGIVFVFFTYSMLASAINEIIASMIAQRGRMLLRGIQKMLNGESIYWWHNLENLFRKAVNPSARHRRYKGSLADDFKQHTLFKRLGKSGRPAYLSDSKFSDIILDVLHRRSKTGNGKTIDALFEPRTFESVKEGMVNVLNELETRKTGKDDCKGNDEACYQRRRQELYEIFSVMLDQSNGDLLRLKKLLENWYNEMMDRVSGWYKRQTHQILLGIGIVLAVLFNVDAIAIINLLQKDKNARETIVKMADSYIQNHPKKDTLVVNGALLIDSSKYVQAEEVINKAYKDAQARADSVNSILGLGWNASYHEMLKTYSGKGKPPGRFGYIMRAIFTDWRKLFGLFITALAIALGGPFWFDVLNKLVNLRMSGKAPTEPSKPANATGAAPGNATAQLDQKPRPGSVG